LTTRLTMTMLSVMALLWSRLVLAALVAGTGVVAAAASRPCSPRTCGGPSLCVDVGLADDALPPAFDPVVAVIEPIAASTAAIRPTTFAPSMALAHRLAAARVLTFAPKTSPPA